MSSPFLLRLSTQIDSAKTAHDQLVARAELAGALARYGQAERAQAEISELRRCNTSYDPVVTCWILIAEGQLSHFKALAPTAISSFRGAHALAECFGRDDIAAIARAWLAASMYVAGDVAKAAEHAAGVLRSTPADRENASLSRAHLVVADTFSCAGDAELAARHYRAARHHASVEGDISMQSVVLFNAAAFAITSLSIRQCTGEVVVDQLRGAELQLNSIANLDSGIGVASLSALVPLLRAEWLLCSGRWSEALERYQLALADAHHQGQERWLAKYLAETSLSYAKNGMAGAAKTTAEHAVSHLVLCTDSDTKGIAHARLSETFTLLEEPRLADAHKALAGSEFAAHRLLQEQLSAALSGVFANFVHPR